MLSAVEVGGERCSLSFLILIVLLPSLPPSLPPLFLTTTSKSFASQKASTRSGPNNAMPVPRGEACVPSTTSLAVGSLHKQSLNNCPNGSSLDCPFTIGLCSACSCSMKFKLAPNPPCNTKIFPSTRAASGKRSNNTLHISQNCAPASAPSRRRHSALKP